jgi:pimeloyl-ACP methyl ester carboxylesterase
MSPAAANPAAAFYAGSGLARWIGAALRATERLSPATATRLALRLFFTPTPSKLVARRRPVPAPWRGERLPFEHGNVVLWRRDGAAGRTAAPRPRVLLVHGWAGDAMQLRELGDTLFAAGFEPLLLDFPGHGRSDGWRSSLPQFERTLFAVQARVGPLHGVVAHSLGALASLHAAARGLAVQRLVLLAPSAPPGLVLRWFGHLFGIGERLAQQMHETIERREGTPLHEFEPGWLGARLRQPVLVLHDHDDRAAPLAAARALVHALPDAYLHETRGLSHRRVLRDPAVLQAAAQHLLGAVAG